MSHRLAFMVVLCAIGCADPSEFTGRASEAISGGGNPNIKAPIELQLASRKLTLAGGAPTSFQLWEGVQIAPPEFFVRARDAFQLGKYDDMVQLDSLAGMRGFTHTSFQQTALGVPVEYATFRLTSRAGVVVSGSGRVAPGISGNASPAIQPDAALAAALAAVNAPQYLWQADPSQAPPTGTLTWYSPDLGATVPFRLCYRFSISTAAPTWDSYTVRVDAITGQAFSSEPANKAVNASADGKRLDGVLVKFTADKFGAPPSYRLQESGARQIVTQNRPPGELTQDFIDNDNHWTEVPNRGGVSVHWAAEQFWDFLTSHSIPGVAGGVKTIQYAQGLCPGAVPGPQFDYHLKIAYFCNPFMPGGPPEVDEETVAHELGHALEFSLVDGGHGFASSALEAATLSESFGDIVATSVRAHSGFPADWTLFEAEASPHLPPKKWLKNACSRTMRSNAVMSCFSHSSRIVGIEWYQYSPCL